MPSSAAERFDVIVVGCGPAGLAAAAAAAEEGVSVGLLDRAPRLGGQFWRHAAASPPGVPAFVRLRDSLERAGAALRLAHQVQTVTREEDEWVVRCLRGAEPRLADGVVVLRARRLILATGAYDRQLPFPGWDLPGVLTAGGAQALLKEHGVLAGRTVVVAGTGPFLLPVAAGLLRAGAHVPLVAEANSPLSMARHPLAVLGAASKLIEGAGYLGRLALRRTPYRRRHAVVRALGDGQVEAVEVARLDRAGAVVPNSSTVVACDALAVGWGFTPQLELALQVGCECAVGADGSLVLAVAATQRTSVADVWAAGESTGIGGWELAVVEGEIAGRAAAGRLGSAPTALLRRRAALRRFAAALHATHPVPGFLVRDLPDEVLVCRCEEVPAGAIRAAVTELGATDTRTVKMLTRVGMGWCQGRVCGFGAAAVTAAACERAVLPADLRAVAERPLASPARLSTLASDDE